MLYREVAKYAVIALISLSGCSSNYQIGKFSISQKTIKDLSKNTDKIGNIIDSNKDKIITEEEIRGAISLLEKALEAVYPAEVSKQ